MVAALFALQLLLGGYIPSRLPSSPEAPIERNIATRKIATTRPRPNIASRCIAARYALRPRCETALSIKFLRPRPKFLVRRQFAPTVRASAYFYVEPSGPPAGRVPGLRARRRCSPDRPRSAERPQRFIAGARSAASEDSNASQSAHAPRQLRRACFRFRRPLRERAGNASDHRYWRGAPHKSAFAIASPRRRAGGRGGFADGSVCRRTKAGDA